MARFVAFLRGINLGPNRRVKGEALRETFAALGCDSVATFRASGNVIFEADGEKATDLQMRLERGLGEALGYEVPVFLRSDAELREVAAREAFEAATVAAAKGKPQVAFLRRAPAAAALRDALALATDEDLLAIHGRELHWLPDSGIAGSELDMGAVEAALGPTTVRTEGTVEGIVAKFL